MKAKSTKPFNAMGVISPEAGMTMDIDNVTTFAQLQNMGFIEPVEAKQEKEEPKAKKAKDK